MLDAHQAETIAFITDGDIIHYECLSEDWTAEAVAEMKAAGTDRAFYEFLEAAGISPLSRCGIHEYESERAYDIEQYPDGYSDDLTDWLERKEQLQDLLDELEDSGIGTPQQGMTVLEDLIEEMDDQIEAEVEGLSKVHCGQCGDPIE